MYVCQHTATLSLTSAVACVSIACVSIHKLCTCVSIQQLIATFPPLHSGLASTDLSSCTQELRPLRPQQTLVLAWFSAFMMVNFGLSHTMWGLSKRQNLAIVLYAMIIFIPTVYKVIKKELVFNTDNFMSLSGICIYMYVYIYMHTPEL